MIEILNQQKRYNCDTGRLMRLLHKLVNHYRLKDPEVTLALVNDSPMRTLNRRFLNKDGPTDVLSFPVRESGPDGKYYLGDIIISVPCAARQSKTLGHSLQHELEFLTVHGLLHLKGFEHGAGLEEEQEKIRALWVNENNGL
jgi:probable rRNA maturation factor